MVMASTEYHLDTRIRRRHVPLITQQRRLRHLRSVSARNITLPFQNICSEWTVIFTLHRKLDTPAFYTSEPSGSLNPSWKDFESSNFPENVDTASPYIIVRIWSMTEVKQLLIEWAVFFTGLVFLGEQVPKEGKNFKPNTLIFGMSEGYYGCNDSYQYTSGNSSEFSVKECLDAEVSTLRTSCTLSTLSRIKTVERAIKQTQAAVQRRRNSISNRLQSSQELQELRAQQELLRIKVSILTEELQSQRKKLQFLDRDLIIRKEEFARKRREISGKVDEQKRLLEKRYELSKAVNECRETLLKTDAQLNYRRKELVTELSSIYPITEFPDHMGFSIHSVHLPNSENFVGHDDTMLSVALGYVCHFLLMLSQFTNVPLRYPIHFYGSRSSITDHISSSLPDKIREFPLHLKKGERRSFEYGVFLLNKNIAQIRTFYRLPTLDLPATLPNLHSLLEMRLSVHSGPVSSAVVPRELRASLQSAGPLQNGLLLSDLPKVPSSPDVIRAEGHAQNGPQLSPRSKEANLSSSLDRGLDDIRMLEQSMEPLEANRVEEIPTLGAIQAKLLRQSSHHSSFPNLNSPTEGAAPGSAFEESMEKRSMVLNDSTFYIPSAEEDHAPRAENGGVVMADDFSADLSLRTERLANGKSSFQMQKLRSGSSTDDEQLQQPGGNSTP